MRSLQGTALALVAALALPAAATAQDYYAGKTIRIIVGTGSGGTIDTFIRTFAPYWQRQIPGEPTIIVENMPGSGGIIATNHVYESVQPDGLTLFYGPWIPAAQVLDAPELRADYSRMEFIGASSDIRVTYMRKDVPPGIASPSDLRTATKFNLGGNGPSDWIDLMGRMSLDLLGVDYNYVTGYQGGTALYAAMLSNEIQMSNTSYGTLVTRSADFIAEDGAGLGVYYFCTRDINGEVVRLDLAVKAPCFIDLYKELHGGAEPTGPVWETLEWYVNMAAKVTFVALAPPGTPDEALTALREGFDAAAADPALQALFVERTGVEVTFVPLAEGLEAVRSLGDVSGSVKTTLLEYIESGH